MKPPLSAARPRGGGTPPAGNPCFSRECKVGGRLHLSSILVCFVCYLFTCMQNEQTRCCVTTTRLDPSDSAAGTPPSPPSDTNASEFGPKLLSRFHLTIDNSRGLTFQPRTRQLGAPGFPHSADTCVPLCSQLPAHSCHFNVLVVCAIRAQRLHSWQERS